MAGVRQLREAELWDGQMAEEGQEWKGKYRSREPKQTTHAKTEEKRKDGVGTNRGHQQDRRRQEEGEKARAGLSRPRPGALGLGTTSVQKAGLRGAAWKCPSHSASSGCLPQLAQQWWPGLLRPQHQATFVDAGGARRTSAGPSGTARARCAVLRGCDSSSCLAPQPC